MAVLSLTPLFQGETTQSRLLMPLLQADTVVDAIVNILDNGLSETVYLPRIFSCFAGLMSHLSSSEAGFLLMSCSEERQIGFRT
jgi:hypothetical protein